MSQYAPEAVLLEAWHDRDEDPDRLWQLIEAVGDGVLRSLPWDVRWNHGDDMMQEYRMTVLRTVDLYDPARGKLFAYLTAIAYQSCWTHLGKLSRQRRIIERLKRELTGTADYELLTHHDGLQVRHRKDAYK